MPEETCNNNDIDGDEQPVRELNGGQFRKEIPADIYRSLPVPPFGNGYDGCYGFESWMSDREDNYLWKLYSNVVGLINISDDVGSDIGYLKEEEYTVGEEGNSLSASEVYSTGIIQQ